MASEAIERVGDSSGPAHRMRFATDRATLEREVLLEPYRAPGPGGQRKNRKETAVRLTHQPSGITVIASERRSQAQNREIAFRRLADKLKQLNRPRKRRIPTKPTASAVRRSRETKEMLSKKKHLRLKSSVSLDLD